MGRPPVGFVPAGLVAEDLVPVGLVPEGLVPVECDPGVLVPVGRSLPISALRGARLLGLGFAKSLRLVASSGSDFTCGFAEPYFRGVFISLGGLEVSFNASISSLVKGR